LPRSFGNRVFWFGAAEPTTHPFIMITKGGKPQQIYTQFSLQNGLLRS
jgi:hypothetical protein